MYVGFQFLKRLTLLPMCLMATLASAATSNGTIPTTVKIVPPISLTSIAADCLDFGSIAKGTSTTTIQIPAAIPTTPVYSGDARILSNTTPRPAMFTVGGEEGKMYTITLPTTSTLTSGGNTLTLSSFSCSKASNVGTIGAFGNVVNNFYVGATLTLPSTTVSGIYTGTITVTVAYN